MSGQVYLLVFGIGVVPAAIACTVASYYVMKKKFERELRSDISVEQMVLSEERVAKFLRENQIKPGESIHVIAKALNVVEGNKTDGIKDRATLSEPNTKGEMTVSFRQDQSGEELLFDFAHECGHLINKDPAPATRPEGHSKSETEQLADYVGAALLMPLESVYDYLTENDYIGASSRQQIKLIQTLCRRYGVNRMIALRRVKEVYAVKQTGKI